MSAKGSAPRKRASLARVASGRGRTVKIAGITTNPERVRFIMHLIGSMDEYLALKSRFLQPFSLVLTLMFDGRVSAGRFEQILAFVIVAMRCE